MAAPAEQVAASLAQDIIETQALLDRWIDKSRTDLETLEAKHERALQECESTLKSLRKTEQDLGGRAEEGMRVSEETDERLAALEAEIDALRLREQELPQQLEMIQSRERELRKLVEAKRTEYKEFQSKRSEYVNDLTKGVLMYKHLGLDFERAQNNRLRLVFTQIDPAQPLRDFYFSVNVNERDEYEVEECSPPVDGTRIAALLTQLNTTNDFGGFCKGMRREFKALVAQSSN